MVVLMGGGGGLVVLAAAATVCFHSLVWLRVLPVCPSGLVWAALCGGGGDGW